MAKRNNGTFYRILLWVAGVLFTVGGVYAVFSYRLDDVEGDVQHIKAKEIPKINENKMELIGVKKDIEHLGEKVDRNFTVQSEKMDRNFTVQQQILEEVRK